MRDGLVVVVKGMGNRQQRAIKNTRKVYQLTVKQADKGTRKVQYRYTTCW